MFDDCLTLKHSNKHPNKQTNKLITIALYGRIGDRNIEDLRNGIAILDHEIELVFLKAFLGLDEILSARLSVHAGIIVVYFKITQLDLEQLLVELQTF